MSSEVLNKINGFYQTNKNGDSAVELFKELEDKDAVGYEGYTPVHFAALYADFQSLAYLAEKGFYFNVTSGGGETPLHTLARYYMKDGTPLTVEKIEKSARILLDNKVPPLKKNSSGRTCYHIAAAELLYPFLNVFISSGINMSLKADGGMTVLHFAAAKLSNFFYNYKSAVSRYESLKMYTPADMELIVAEAEEKQGKVIKYAIELLGVGYDYTDKTSEKIISGIKSSQVYEGLSDGVKEDICRLGVLDSYGVTGINEKLADGSYKYANEVKNYNSVVEADKNYIGIIRALVDYGIDTEEKDQNGRTAADYLNGDDEIIIKYKLILQNKAGGSDAGDSALLAASKGYKIDEAVKKGDTGAIEALLKLGTGINDPYGEHSLKIAPLYWAAMYDKYDPVKLLLDNGADVGKTYDNDENILCIMAKYGSAKEDEIKNKVPEKILRLLVEHGVNINGSVDNSYDTLLHKLMYLNDNTIYSLGSYDRSLLNEAIKLGGDLNAKNAKGMTPLMIGCINYRDYCSDKINTLVENGADMSVVDNKGNTALMYLILSPSYNSAVSTAEIMSEYGDINIGAVNNDGKTALDLATEREAEDFVKFILSKI